MRRNSWLLVIGLVAVGTLPVRAQGQTRTLTAKELFDPSRLVDVQIQLDPADWKTLKGQTRSFSASLGKTPAVRPYTYFWGSVVVDGVKFDRVRVRKKGFIGSLDAKRPSLKVRFRGKDRVSGLDRLTLNNNKQDRSLISQALGYKVFADAGVVSPRCNLAKVTVNGEYLGIYSNVESIRAPFLEHGFGDSSGDLYEGTLADLFVDRLEKFELKTADTDRRHLERIAEVLAADALDLDELGKLLDIEAFIRFWAMESLTGFWDGYTNDQNNFFIYRLPKNGKLYFVPWGMDDSFTNTMPLPPYRLKIKSVHGNALLAVRLYAEPKTRELYRKTLVGLMKDHWNETALLEEVDRLEMMLKDQFPEAQDDFPRAIAKVRRFIKGRRADLEEELAEWPVKLKTEARKPAYFKQVGEAVGTFSTTWRERAPAQPLENGKAELKLTLEGEVIAFKQLGVSAERSTWPQAPGERGPQPPTIVFTGRRASDGKKVVLAVSLPIEEFRPTGGKGTNVQGVMFEGALGFLNFSKMKMVHGEAQFEHAAIKPDAAVEGRLTVRVMQMVGGF